MPLLRRWVSDDFRCRFGPCVIAVRLNRNVEVGFGSLQGLRVRAPGGSMACGRVRYRRPLFPSKLTFFCCAYFAHARVKRRDLLR